MTGILNYQNIFPMRIFFGRPETHPQASSLKIYIFKIFHESFEEDFCSKIGKSPKNYEFVSQPIFGPDLSQWRKSFISNIIFNISKIN
jgi:hypothetical protein